MDSSTYAALTGKAVSDMKTFKLQLRLAKKTLERMLGYPLCPDDWDNQYLEIGKTRDDWAYPDVDTSQLDAPDAVVESYRFFTWNPRDEFLAIDPAITINAVKLVKGGAYEKDNKDYNGYTFKTLEPGEYRPQWMNGTDMPFTKYLRIHQGRYPYLPKYWTPDSFPFRHYYYSDDLFQVAVDAEWAFEELPLELLKVWADLIGANSMEQDKTDVRSESIGSYSYTRFDKNSGPNAHVKAINVQAYGDMLADFAGPNGRQQRVPVL